ncbi:MAG: HlyD family efflux transporter periplasmic adaptor subunit [Victivallaceae bacterium]|jgi:HlyD family secretion protein
MKHIFTTSSFLAAAAISLTISGCGDKPEGFQGYVEADMVYISPVLGGRLEKIYIDRGDFVKKDARLFDLDSTEYAAAVAESEANLRKTQDDLNDLLKGVRPEEIKALKAKISKLEAICELAKIVHDRNTLLLAKDAIATKEHDTSRLLQIQNKWELEESKRNLEIAQLPAREDRIMSAKEAVKAAENALAGAKWRLEQRFVKAEQDAFVFDTLMRRGEYAAAGTPVLMLIPPTNMKVRFFVTYPDVQKIHAADKIVFYPDGGQERYQAKVSNISLKPEYTPPVIYSRDSNSKLIFMIEADVDPQCAFKVNPGMPVTVKLLNAGNK